MKGRGVIYIFTLIIALVMVGAGCDSAKGGGVVDMMKKVPQDCWSFMYMDMDAFRTDADLEEVFVLLSEDRYKNWTDIIGIDFREVDGFAAAGRDFGDFNMLFEGDFDLERVRKKGGGRKPVEKKHRKFSKP